MEKKNGRLDPVNGRLKEGIQLALEKIDGGSDKSSGDPVPMLEGSHRKG